MLQFLLGNSAGHVQIICSQGAVSRSPVQEMLLYSIVSRAEQQSVLDGLRESQIEQT